jgi:uncharacterized protein
MAEAAAADFHARQRAFTAHLRDPDRCPAPSDIEDRRMGIYRELIFNNLESLLSAHFPVIHRLLPQSHWKSLVRDFLIRHRARTPLFTELPQEFLDFLSNERAGKVSDPPFLLELAHYEWVDLALLISDEEPDLTGVDPNGDLLCGSPVLSPLAWPLSYRFPVHRITPEFQPAEPPGEPTYLVAYRARSDRVEFMETNVVTQRLLALLQEVPASSGYGLLNQIAEELSHPAPEQVLEFGARLLEELRARGVLLGTRRPPP